MSAAAETASTTGALGSIRWGVLAICAVAATVEGYDLQVVGYVAPAISREWNLAAGAFGPTFSIGLGKHTKHSLPRKTPRDMTN